VYDRVNVMVTIFANFRRENCVFKNQKNML
jgi:hypothetical protein